MRMLVAGNRVAPTLATACAALPSMQVRARRIGSRGFTLIELLIVVAIMAVATGGVSLALRDNSGSALEREGQRLAALLETARAQSRMTAMPVHWRITADGFTFDGLGKSDLPTHWLNADTVVAGAPVILLGPEPVIGPQSIRLVSLAKPGNSVTLATDGVRPFSVSTQPAAGSGS